MRLTRFGAAVIVILVVCALVVALVSGPVRFLAASVGGLLLVMLVGEGVGSGFANPDNNLGRGGEFARKREVLMRNARPRRRP